MAWVLEWAQCRAGLRRQLSSAGSCAPGISPGAWQNFSVFSMASQRAISGAAGTGPRSRHGDRAHAGSPALRPQAQAGRKRRPCALPVRLRSFRNNCSPGAASPAPAPPAGPSGRSDGGAARRAASAPPRHGASLSSKSVSGCLNRSAFTPASATARAIVSKACVMKSVRSVMAERLTRARIRRIRSHRTQQKAFNFIADQTMRTWNRALFIPHFHNYVFHLR
jgi:hypothetical protein